MTNIKWTSGGGPAPLPVSKKRLDEMGVKEKDLPSYYFPDSHATNNSGGSALAVFLIVCGLVAYWSIGRLRMGGTFSSGAGPPAVASEESIREAREARLKRFGEGSAYQRAMREAVGGEKYD
ncbi:unnamed protein product [Chrysoparadoxa australica]